MSKQRSDASPQIAVRAGHSSRASASRWRCRGWNRCPASVDRRRWPRRRGRRTSRRRRSASPSSSRATASTRTLVGQGQRRGDGVEPDAAAARTAEDEDQRHRRTVQQVRHRQRHPSGDDRQPAHRRPAQEGRDHPQRHQHGPGARQPHRPGDRAGEPRPRLRGADDRLPRDQLLQRLRLAHLVAERRLADAERDVSVARVRQPVREPRQPAQRQRPRPRQGPRRDAPPPDQRRATRPSSTST